MSWISGPCNDGHDEAFNVELESNVVRERDDEQPEREMWGGATHFHVVLNERTYGSGRPRGTARD